MNVNVSHARKNQTIFGETVIGLAELGPHGGNDAVFDQDLPPAHPVDVGEPAFDDNGFHRIPLNRLRLRARRSGVPPLPTSRPSHGTNRRTKPSHKAAGRRFYMASAKPRA